MTATELTNLMASLRGVPKGASNSGAVATFVKALDALFIDYAELAAAAPWSGIVKVAGADFTTTSTVIVAITGLQSPTLLTSTLYEFECVLKVNSSTVAGLIFGIDGAGGSLTSVQFSGTGTNAAGTTLDLGQTATNTATVAFCLVAGDGVLEVKGFFLTTPTGTPAAIMKIGKVTSGTAKVYIGSCLKWRLA